LLLRLEGSECFALMQLLLLLLLLPELSVMPVPEAGALASAAWLLPTAEEVKVNRAKEVSEGGRKEEGGDTGEPPAPALLMAPGPALGSADGSKLLLLAKPMKLKEAAWLKDPLGTHWEGRALLPPNELPDAELEAARQDWEGFRLPERGREPEGEPWLTEEKPDSEAVAETLTEREQQVLRVVETEEELAGAKELPDAGGEGPAELLAPALAPAEVARLLRRKGERIGEASQLGGASSAEPAREALAGALPGGLPLPGVLAPAAKLLAALPA
jgi:hypothetical protein